MLVFHPEKRISVEEALAHPWLAALHDETDEPVAEVPFTFDVPGQLPPDTAADLMWKEVLKFHPELAAAGAGQRPTAGKAKVAVIGQQQQQEFSKAVAGLKVQ